jgi:hypothetical protein
LSFASDDPNWREVLDSIPDSTAPVAASVCADIMFKDCLPGKQLISPNWVKKPNLTSVLAKSDSFLEQHPMEIGKSFYWDDCHFAGASPLLIGSKQEALGHKHLPEIKTGEPQMVRIDEKLLELKQQRKSVRLEQRELLFEKIEAVNSRMLDFQRAEDSFRVNWEGHGVKLSDLRNAVQDVWQGFAPRAIFLDAEELGEVMDSFDSWAILNSVSSFQYVPADAIPVFVVWFYKVVDDLRARI